MTQPASSDFSRRDEGSEIQSASSSAYSRMVFLLLPTVAMSLGWGLRGTIGGGPMGAMIPGAIVTVCLCHLLGWKSYLGTVVAIGAVGIAIGGQETYGQTIGFLKNAATVPWGLLGLTIKGAMWGLSGGVLVGLAFANAKYRWWEIAIGLGLMAAATVAGREFIDQPKTVYFSNLLDKPREEIWVGITLGAVALLIFVNGLRREKISTAFAWGGLVAGAAGFGGGSLFLALGNTLPQPYRGWEWWKMMEFTFGALFGLGLGLVGYRFRAALQNLDDETTQIPRIDPLEKCPAGVIILFGLTVAMGAVTLNFTIPYRASYSLIAPGLILLSLWSNRLAWHVALSMTICGFLRDFLRGGVERQWFDVRFDNWFYVLLATLPIVAILSAIDASKRLSSVRALLGLTWFATLFGLVKMSLPHNGAIPSLFVSAVFIIELFVTSFLVLSNRSNKVVV